MSAHSPIETALAYHERTKHLPGRWARSLGYLDWDTQPDPFRRFAGAPLVSLDVVEPGGEPRYEAAFVVGGIAPAPLDRRAISQLFFDSLALSAWKQSGPSRWALRVNPSSGNLHPTEGYLVAGPIPALEAEAAVYHYAPLEHALERRTVLPPSLWSVLSQQLPDGAVLVGLSSIYWREAWKYGERAFRYCQHDLGHAISAFAVAAAGLGWEARLLESVDDSALATLLGIAGQLGAEKEWPEALLVIFPHTKPSVDALHTFSISPEVIAALRSTTWLGEPNLLSSDHHPWPEIDAVAEATRHQVLYHFTMGGPVDDERLETLSPYKP